MQLWTGRPHCFADQCCQCALQLTREADKEPPRLTAAPPEAAQSHPSVTGPWNKPTERAGRAAAVGAAPF